MTKATLGDLLDALEDLVDEFPGIEDFPFLISDLDDRVAGFLVKVDTDGENVLLTFKAEA